MGIILSKFKKHKIRNYQIERALIEKLENKHGVSNKKKRPFRNGVIIKKVKAKRKGKTKLTNPQS